jgi:hypothetical protein
MALITIAEAKIPNWTGSSSIKLFIAPDKSFVVDGEEVQGGNLRDPDEKASWIITIACTVTNEADARGETVPTLNVPAIKLLSTADSDDPTTKYQQKLGVSKGQASSAALLGLRTFRLPASPTYTTWQAIRTYNLAAQSLTPADNLAAYVSAAVAEEAAAREAAQAIFTATITEDTTLDIGDALRALILIDSSDGDVTATLQPAADMANREITFKKISDDGSLAIVDAGGDETIDGRLVFNLEMVNQTLRLIPVGDSWHIV